MYVEGNDAPIYVSHSGKRWSMKSYRCPEVDVPALGPPHYLSGVFDCNVDACLSNEEEGPIVDEKVGVGVKVGGNVPRLIAYAESSTAHSYFGGYCKVGFAEDRDG